MSILEERLTPTSLGGLPIRKARDANPHINGLIYGEYGSGKTLLAATADDVPEMRKVLCLDIEGGTFTLKHPYPNVEVVRITNWNQMADIYNELRAGLHTDYNTCIIDSLTEAQYFNMSEVMRQLVEAKPDRNPDVPDVREWGINQTQIKRFIRLYRDLPMTVIMTALMAEKTNKQTGETKKGADLPGKLAGQVPALFDEVWMLYVKSLTNEQLGITGPKVDPQEKKEVRILSTGATATSMGKDRSGKLPKFMVNPTMPQIWNIMQGKEGTK